MILIDALYINTGGGLNLLNTLFDSLKNKNNDYFLLLDYRLKDQIILPKNINNKNLVYKKATLFNRHIFYLKNKNKYNKIFTFASLPPSLKLNIPVYTYFHNLNLLINSHKLYSTKFYFSAFKKYIFFLFHNNTDYWIVQTKSVSNILLQHPLFTNRKIIILPFFDILNHVEITKIDNRKNINFIYVSEYYPHKNHNNLIKAFNLFYKSNKNTTLYLTINKANIDSNLIEETSGVIYLGKLNKNDLSEFYKKMDIVIYPSLYESFGLGLIEAAQYNLPIIASNLKYVYDVVTPNDVFDPNDIFDICLKMSDYKNILNKKSTLKIENKINEIINLITNE